MRIWLLSRKTIQVGLSYAYIHALVILADQLFKTIGRKKGGIYEKYEPSTAPINTQRLLKVQRPPTGLIPNQ